MLVHRPVLEGDDPPLRARPRLALLDDLRLRVDRVAVKEGLRELDPVEPEVAHGGAERGLADGEPDGDAEREDAVDERLPELRLGRRVEVDVQGLRVHGEAGEEDVVGLGDRAARLVAKHLAHQQLLEMFPRHLRLLGGG